MALDGLLQSLLKHLKASEQSDASARFFQHFGSTCSLVALPSFRSSQCVCVFAQSGGRSGTASSCPVEFEFSFLTEASR